MGKPRGTLYRGGPGMITWVLHRITGVLIFLFLFAHILDTSLVAVGDGRLYDGVVEVYRNPIVTLMEMGLVVAVIYHAMNGVKVTLIDFWSKGTERIRALTAATVALTVLLSVAAVGIMGKSLIQELQGRAEQLSAAND